MARNEKFLRIVTNKPDKKTGLTKTQGTQVFAGDTELTGITRIVLTADVNDVWRAQIDVMIQPPADLVAESFVSYPDPTPPPCRIEHRGFLCAFFGPEPEFDIWIAEPWWKRVLGFTAWDRNNGV